MVGTPWSSTVVSHFPEPECVGLWPGPDIAFWPTLAGVLIAAEPPDIREVLERCFPSIASALAIAAKISSRWIGRFWSSLSSPTGVFAGRP